MTGEIISAHLSTGEATGAHLTGSLGQGVILSLLREELYCEQVRMTDKFLR